MLRIQSTTLAALVSLMLGLAASVAPAAPTIAPSSSVIVKVLDQHGKPVAGARVGIFKPGIRKERDQGEKPTPVAKGETDQNGVATLTDVPAGRFVVIAGLKGEGTGHAPAYITPGSSIHLNIILARDSGDAKPADK